MRSKVPASRPRGPAPAATTDSFTETRMKVRIWSAAAGILLATLGQAALAQNVKVTPLGGFDGEFCAQDRAMIFEDPNGPRILYDPGRSVAGPEDPRLGKIDVVLVSHMHGD